MIEHLVLHVGGMTCGGCEKRVEKVLGRLDGVRGTTGDHRSGEVRVLFDPTQTSVAAMAEAIRTAGYDVAAGTGTEDR